MPFVLKQELRQVVKLTNCRSAALLGLGTTLPRSPQTALDGGFIFKEQLPPTMPRDTTWGSLERRSEHRAAGKMARAIERRAKLDFIGKGESRTCSYAYSGNILRVLSLFSSPTDTILIRGSTGI